MGVGEALGEIAIRTKETRFSLKLLSSVNLILIRSTTVVCIEKCEFAELSYEGYNKIICTILFMVFVHIIY